MTACERSPADAAYSARPPAPYYAGAFGAALVSDGVDASDALVFLFGANLGASSHEYGV